MTAAAPPHIHSSHPRPHPLSQGHGMHVKDDGHADGGHWCVVVLDSRWRSRCRARPCGWAPGPPRPDRSHQTGPTPAHDAAPAGRARQGGVTSLSYDAQQAVKAAEAPVHSTHPLLPSQALYNPPRLSGSCRPPTHLLKVPVCRTTTSISTTTTASLLFPSSPVRSMELARHSP